MLKRKNIAVVFEDSRFGGPHQQFLNILRYSKHEFKILISYYESNFFTAKIKRINRNFQIQKIIPLSINKNYFIKYFLFFFFDIYKIINFIKKSKSEYIYIPGGVTCIKTLFACIITKKKLIWHIHDCHSNFIFVLIFKVFKKFSKRIIFASFKSLNYYSGIDKNRNYIVLQSGIEKLSVRFKKKNFVIGTLANFNPIKNLKLIIKIAKISYKLDKSIKFLIVGKVWKSQKKFFLDLKEDLKKNKVKNVNISDRLINKKKFFEKISVYLCTSLSESSPLSIWEAMSCKIPIISSDIGDISKIAKKKSFIIKNYNPHNFIKAILKLKKNKKIYKKFSKDSDFLFKKNFNIKNYIIKFDNLFI